MSNEKVPQPLKRKPTRKPRRSEAITWSQVQASQLQAFITAATEDGCLVSFARTTDGGSLVVYLKQEDERFRDYVKYPEDFETIALELLDKVGFELEALPVV